MKTNKTTAYITQFANGAYLRLLALFLPLLLAGCSSLIYDATEEASAKEPTYMAVDVRAVAGTQTLAAEEAVSTNPEMRINTLRILIFDHATGDLRYNIMRAGTMVTQHTLSATAAWHGGFQIEPGTYDFFFVANEEVGHSAMQAALVAIQNRSEFFTNAALTRYEITPAEFLGTAPAMVMTQCYENITVEMTRNGKGKSMSDPQHFLDPIGNTERIPLVRTLAKATLTVQDLVEKVGTKYYLKFKHLNELQTLTLVNQPNLSLFGTPYFSSSAKKYTEEYYPSNTVATNSSVLQDFTGVGGLEQYEVEAARVSAGSVAGKYNYAVVRYVPELLRKSATTETQANLKVPNALNYNFNNMGGTYYSVSVDHRTFNDLTGTTNPSGETTKDYYTLPNSADYSRYSVLRNTHYDIKAKENDTELLLEYRVEPWDLVILKPVYVGNYFNIWIEDCAFGMATQKVTIITSMPDAPLDAFRVELKPLNGNSFNATSVLHVDAGYEKRSEYTLTSVASLPVGTPMFEIYYSGKKVATITKSATDAECAMPITTP